MQRSERPIRIESTGHLCLGDGMVMAMRHVLFPRPKQLHRSSGRFLSNRHGLPNVIGKGSPTESAAKRDFVNITFAGGQT